jgi:hypothetical protein
MKIESKFFTSEFYLSITLLALKEELITIEKSDNSNRAIFVFKQSRTLNKHIEDFRQGKLLVEPQALFIQHKLLKSRLYNSY